MKLQREVHSNVNKSEETSSVMSNSSQKIQSPRQSIDNALTQSIPFEEMTFVVDDDSNDAGGNEDAVDRSRTESEHNLDARDRSRTESEHNLEVKAQDEGFEETMFSRVPFMFKNPKMVLPITDVNTMIIDPSEV